MELREMLAAVAPGTPLRDGLERILSGRTGAIVVLGYNELVQSICSGGFELDVEFTPARLRELAKMDGAVILDGTRIRRANAQLLPDQTIDSLETGMRHRTAERVSRQTGFPVISVSQSMRVITLYLGGARYAIEGSDVILFRANQALSTLERYVARLNEVLTSLTALEIEDLVTVRDVVTAMQRVEMVSRIWDEADGYVTELGTDGRLLNLQLEELVSGVGRDRALISADFLEADSEVVHTRMYALSAAQLANPDDVARALGFGAGELDTQITSRGYRLLSQIARLPESVAETIAAHAGSLQALLSYTVEDLQQIEGIGPYRARLVRDGLAQLAESAILERRY